MNVQCIYCNGWFDSTAKGCPHCPGGPPLTVKVEWWDGGDFPHVDTSGYYAKVLDPGDPNGVSRPLYQTRVYDTNRNRAVEDALFWVRANRPKSRVEVI